MEAKHAVSASEAKQDPASLASEQQPLLSFGVIADVQYADADDAWDWTGKRQRHYRNSLAVLRKAVASWSAASSSSSSSSSSSPIRFIAQLGDLIDGKNSTSAELSAAGVTAATALADVRQVMDECAVKDWIHCIGNHELYNFDRGNLPSSGLFTFAAQRSAPEASFSFMVPTTEPLGLRFVVLDPFEIGVLGNEPGSYGHQAALEHLSRTNPNDLNSPGSNWLADLEGIERRHLPSSGGLGPRQLAWLRSTLAAAKADGERVVIFSHVPMLPGASTDTTLLWNYEEALEILRGGEKLELAGVVVAVLTGHDHIGGYAVDEKTGTHHVTIPSPLETKPGAGDADCTFGTVDVFADRLELRSAGGILKSRTLGFPAGPAAAAPPPSSSSSCTSSSPSSSMVAESSGTGKEDLGSR